MSNESNFDLKIFHDYILDSLCLCISQNLNISDVFKLQGYDHLLYSEISDLVQYIDLKYNGITNIYICVPLDVVHFYYDVFESFENLYKGDSKYMLFYSWFNNIYEKAINEIYFGV